MAGLPALSDVLEEYQLVDAEDRYRLLIDLGRQLEPMPEALKTDATMVRGCSASVWVYPVKDNSRLHFVAARVGVGVGFFHEPPMRRFHGGEVGVAFELQRVERAHLVAAAATVAWPAPLPLRRLAKALGVPLLLRRPLRRLLGVEPGEIIPVLVVLGCVRLAEVPAILAVR